MPKTSDQKPRRFRPLHPVWRVVRSWVRKMGHRPDRLADRGYMVCAVPRSGSTYFDQLLSSTGLLGHPREYFNYGPRSRSDPDYPADPRLQLRRVLTAGATRNGIYGVKAFPRHLDAIKEQVDVFRDLPKLRIVTLKRRDVLGQAISLARAQQSGHFVARAATAGPIAYDQAQIRRCIDHVTLDDRGWDAILGPRAIATLHLHYEDILDNAQQAVDRVAGFVGVRQSTPIRWQQVRTRIQRDDVSEDWRHRFLAETGDEFRHLSHPHAQPG